MTLTATPGFTAEPSPAVAGPRLYYMSPLLAGPLRDWEARFAWIASLGFDRVVVASPFRPVRHGSLMLPATFEALHPALEWDGTCDEGLAAISRKGHANGLSVLIDTRLDRVADGSPLSRLPGGPFDRPDTTLDPRRFDPDGDAAHATLDNLEGVDRLGRFWATILGGWAACGISGVRFASLRGVPPGLIRHIADAAAPLSMALLGNMQGLAASELPGFVGCGLDYVFSSLPWWDGHDDWYWREHALLRRIAPVITAAEEPFCARVGEREHDPARRLGLQRRGLNMSALLGAGWMVVMGAEYAARHRLSPRRDTPDGWRNLQSDPGTEFADLIRSLNELRCALPALSGNGEPRVLSSPGADVLAVLRPQSADARLPGTMAMVAVNMRGNGQPASIAASQLFVNAGGYCAPAELPSTLTLAPGQATAEVITWQSFEGALLHNLDAGARIAAREPRIAIEAVTPTVDGGRFPARFVLGEWVEVQADIVCDGHDMLCAEIRWRGPASAPSAWNRAPMRPLGNDRWQGRLPLVALGVHHFTIEAWKDGYGTYRDELSKKFAAGLDVTLEIEEGRLLIGRREATAGVRRADVGVLSQALLVGSNEEKTALLLSDETAALMNAIDPRAYATWVDPPFPLEAERTAARFASWYEIFPRSMSDDADRHGTFDDVIAHLPRIARMGFDVLYFPPIHPIGEVNRKGPNNSLVTSPGDPGSPYGIADHMKIHPELGTLADFRRLRDAALAEGMELALDFAVQCAPDHPWLKEHKGWFDWRPDGSIRYAENPPKKYQDIVNVDFYTNEAIDGLWAALCRVVLFWCDQGVRIFRVDNPHTKPLPFWHWMIGEVHARFPDTLFLAEAFTKPKMMNRLAKVGFSQSYTYFTWRTTKAELRDYMVELTTTAARDFFRPNFFVNTPDINPVFLQHSGRPGHLIRAALAATLAGLWGVYCGFELCEATPLPGREEYLDSEKYQIRVWDWAREGNIIAQITRLNWIRRTNPALQTHLGVTFLESHNDQVLYFEKATTDRSNVVLVAINLDPSNAQEAWYEVPLWRWQLPDTATVRADDLISEETLFWTGKMQHVRLDPGRNPYAIWRVRPV